MLFFSAWGRLAYAFMFTRSYRDRKSAYLVSKNCNLPESPSRGSPGGKNHIEGRFEFESVK